MNCKDKDKDKGYEVGQVFEVVKEQNDANNFTKGSIVVLSNDDDTEAPKFDLIHGHCEYPHGIKTKRGAYCSLHNVKRIWPPEEKSTMVTVICEGKETEISRESAEKLNLV